MKNILVVDDNPCILEGCRLFLSNQCRGYHILTASDGREAVNIITSLPVDAVLTDLQMPGMDGYELIKFVRKHYPSVLLFAMTGDYTPAKASRLSALGVLWSLEKPFSFDVMASKIAADLRNTPSAGQGMPPQAAAVH